MSFDKKNAHFTELGEEEKKAILFQLGQGRGEVVLWRKGEEGLFPAQAVVFSVPMKSLTIRAAKEAKDMEALVGKLVFFNFVTRGKFFFATGALENEGEPGLFRLRTERPLFRCERRKNFRLPASSVNDIKILFQFMDNAGQENVILDFPHKDSEKEIQAMQRFMELMKQKSPLGETQRAQVYPVKDVSISGVAFFITQFETDFFYKDKILKSFIIRFNKITYEIPGGKVVAVVPFKDPRRPLTKLFKVAVEYVKLPEEVDLKMSKQLNEGLRELDTRKIFEEFVK